MRGPGRGSAKGRLLVLSLAVALAVSGCKAQPAIQSPPRLQGAISDADFAALVARISEPGGFFDTDNLISNEGGYLKVVDALARLELKGGAFVGVGPDQSFSYIAEVRPDIVFMTDVRRDNMLHHLLLKALMERAPTRVEFLAGLHGRVPPGDAVGWGDRSVDDVMSYIDQSEPLVDLEALRDEVAAAVREYGLPLTAEDYATMGRFHQTFIDAGPSLRFTSFGRPPRPYYPTYRQLVLETDFDGDQASYLASAERYEVVRALQLSNRIVPVVGDMSGPRAIREMGVVMREMGVELEAFYTSNVEFYLWRGGTFEAWRANLESMPLADDAVIIRSYFPTGGGYHPSTVPGYYSAQTLQPASVLIEGGFRSYWDAVTRGIISLGPIG